MQYGFVIPGGDAREVANLARSAEQAGWDGVFVAETVWGVDAWVSLAAAAMVTERIRLGTLLSPVSRMRPWKLASETATLDRLSNGRVTLSVGLGALDTGFAEFGEVTDRKTRAALLDEGLDILTGLWRGQPFSYDGTHFQITPTTFFPPPPPMQQPRIPIWVSAAWPKPKSLARALRYDGLLPVVMGDEGARKPTVDEVREMRGYVDQERGNARRSISWSKAKHRAMTAKPAAPSWRPGPMPAQPGGSKPSGTRRSTMRKQITCACGLSRVRQNKRSEDRLF